MTCDGPLIFDTTAAAAIEGLLAPLTHLRSLRLRWYWSAGLAGLAPSVRSVDLQLPGTAFSQARLQQALAAGQAVADATEQLNGQYQQLGVARPLAEVSWVMAACLRANLSRSSRAA